MTTTEMKWGYYKYQKEKETDLFAGMIDKKDAVIEGFGLAFLFDQKLLGIVDRSGSESPPGPSLEIRIQTKSSAYARACACD